jgi:hypothetical protein
MSVSYSVLGFEVADDCHVVESAVGNDLLPLCDRPTVLFLNRRKESTTQVVCSFVTVRKLLTMVSFFS